MEEEPARRTRAAVRSLLAVQPRLPDIPLGAGARWKVETTFRGSPGTFFGTTLPTNLTATYTLSSWRRTRFGLGATLRLHVHVRAESDSPTLPVRAHGQGDGTLVLLASGILVSYEAEIEMTAKARKTSSRSRTTYQVQIESLRPASGKAWVPGLNQPPSKGTN